MKMSQPLLILESVLWHDFAQETGGSKKGFALIVKNGKLGLDVF
jgi:hypothetical protein